MIAAATWPSGQNDEATGRYEDHAGGQGPPAQPPEDHEPAHLVIAEMADLVRDTSGSAIADGCILSAVSIGIALEAGLSAHVVRPGLAGVSFVREEPPGAGPVPALRRGLAEASAPWVAVRGIAPDTSVVYRVSWPR